ncbi:MAG TPA: hybrid sensor histidine kinase/response regulator [Candidatus Saccharimonadia bacterium]|nr:hybrid sensor histidine kinase/response regulator [Candidatus Saccharimonadia bacterium]
MPLFDLAGDAVAPVPSTGGGTRRSRAAIGHPVLRADPRKDEFLGMLAHELRNPLAPIRSAAALLARHEQIAPAAARHAVEVIERQVAHLARLVDDLLDVTRITHGKLRLRRDLTALDAIIDAAIEANLAHASANRVRFRVVTPPSGAWIDGDAVRLTQVFSNLLHNAAKFSFSGGSVEIDVHHEGDGHIVVRVRDFGTGISDAAIGAVFDLFTQEKHALGRDHGGLGIGLALVRELTGMHGGTVAARSDGIGLGSTFTVTLPAAAALAPAGTPGAVPGPKLHRILLVDDNRDAAEAMQALLACDGHTVVLAHTGLAAVALAAEFAPDIAVLDIGLPDITGYDVARRLRAQTGGTEIVLIALTGYGRDEDQREVVAAGFDHHMVKPADTARLAAILAAAT